LVKMDLESRERAENKVILLYFINKVKIPVSNMQLTRIMLENRCMNYFLLQQSIHEMQTDNLIVTETKDNIDYYTLSQEGIKMLDMFKDLIPRGIQARLDENIDAIRSVMRLETSIIAEYTLENENEYQVKCRILEDFNPLIDIRLSVGSREDARSICKNWKNHAKEIYPQVIGVLLGKEKEITDNTNTNTAS
jgi:predicted transcriptional regulator